jgi:hypothetical protein
MCLYVDKGNKKHIAKEPILCLKWVNMDGSSMHYHFKYETNKSYQLTVPFKSEFKNFQHIVNEGFHSYRDYDPVRRELVLYGKIFSRHHDYKLLICSIPTGAEYYIGVDAYQNECYASNKICILEEVNGYMFADVEDFRKKMIERIESYETES